MKVILVSAVALIDADGRVLLAQRPEGKSMAGLWEFPGGKVEAGETPEAAPKPVLLALDIETGKTLWSKQLPVPAENWGLAIDRDGRLIVTLTDGRVVCYGK